MRTICGRLCAKIAGGDGGSDGVTVILWFYSKRVSLQLSLIEMQIWALHQNTSDYYGPCPPSHKRARCVVSALQSPGITCCGQTGSVSDLILNLGHPAELEWAPLLFGFIQALWAPGWWHCTNTSPQRAHLGPTDKQHLVTKVHQP